MGVFEGQDNCYDSSCIYLQFFFLESTDNNSDGREKNSVIIPLKKQARIMIICRMHSLSSLLVYLITPRNRLLSAKSLDGSS